MLFFKELAASTVLVSLFLSFSAHSSVSQDGLWSDLSFKSSVAKEFSYRSLQANTDQLIDKLKSAPLEGSSEQGLELHLPLSGGSFVRVAVYESPIMASELASKFPSIKTYKVFGLDEKQVTGRLDIGPLGFHGMLDTAEGSIYIEPESSYTKSASVQQYRSFNKSAYPENTENFKCSIEGHEHKSSNFSYLSRATAKLGTAFKSSGTKKRTYRLAVAATNEYTATVSASGGNGTVAEGQAAIVTAINRINQIYEKEVAVKFELVANNSSVVHLGPADDGLDNTSANNLIDQIQGKLDSVIGQANYDIGHVFATTPGGVARLGSVCEANNQAKGVTGTNNPVGDPFVVDYVAHEIGHQFAAQHSFNAGGLTSGSCDDFNRTNHTSTVGGTPLSDAAYEPGSGSTIMAYANICHPQNIQGQSDDYFHARSLEQIRDFVDGLVGVPGYDGSTCGVETNTGDTIPTVEAGSNYTIPGSTPFALTGVGADVDAADVGTLTYTWEQYDLGSKSTTLPEMHTDADTRPLFRSYKGTSSPTRYFPALTAILSGNLESITGERLPTTDRDMKFRLTVRSGAQGFNQDDMTVTVDKDAGPLLVIAPAAASTFSGSSDTTVTWDVANTTAVPVNCANMAISYSTDSGQNFDTTLLASTPNDGSQSVTLPNTTTTQGRIKVQCQNNIFFNVSPGDFNVNAVGSLAISALSANKFEGDSSTTAYTFNVVRSGSTAGIASVNYIVSGDGSTPADAADFGGSFPGGTVNFADGESNKILTINVAGDTEPESYEGFKVTLFSPVNASLPLLLPTASGNIFNDDASLSIAATSADKAEGDSGTTAYTFTVSRTDSTTGTASASYAVTSATADGADFGGSFPTGTVNFADGDSSKVVTINVSGDTTVESDETFTVTLSAPVSAVIGTAAANGTIQNDDESLSIAATSAVKSEGNSSTTAFTFTVSRTGNTTGTASASYAVTSATADGADFGGSFPTGTVNFADGDSSKVVTINVSGDTTVEPDETFTVTLSVPVSAVIGTAAANGTIQNDDESLSIAATSAVKFEGDSSTTAFTFTVSRTGNTAGTASASYAVTSAAADGADFGGSFPTGTVDFAGGDSSKVITINVSGDTAVELDEVFTVTLSAPVSAVIGTAAANGTIQNDDESLSIVATSAVKLEGDSSTTVFTFTVNRTGNTTGTASASYAVTSATADGADFGGSFPTGTVNFADGDSSKVVTINVSGDTAVESDETFTITLSAPVSTIIGMAVANGTIQNDDASVSIAATSAVKAEGHSGNTAYTFTVTRTGNISASATVNYAVTGASTADFLGGAYPTGTVNFAGGSSSALITVSVVGDIEVEGDENFTVTLNTPSSGMVIGTATANGTIQNDDASVSVAATSAVKAEGQTGNTAYTFTVTRTGNTTATATVGYVVTGNGATAADFVGGTFPSGTANFAAGASSAVITINVAVDTVVESDEGFTLTLNSPSTGTVIATAVANGTILNDDASLAVAATSASNTEGHSSTTSFTFTVTRTGDTTGAASVAYAVVGSGANTADAADFGGTLPSGTLNFASGSSSEVITIAVSGDTDVEMDEGFTVTLSGPSVGAIIDTAAANGLIENDDAALVIAATDADQLEGNAGNTAFTFTVTRSGNTTGVASANYAVTGSGANAADGADFGGSLPTGTVNFSGGEMTKVITVNVSGDTDTEALESFDVTLTSPSIGTVISTVAATGLIKNDDGPVEYSVTVLAADQAEGNTGSTSFTFNVVRSGSPLSSGTETIDYAVTGSSNNAATAGDFTGGFTTATLTFGANEHTKVVTVDVAGDVEFESNESFAVTLSNASAGAITTAIAEGVIQNDDAALSIAATSVVKSSNNMYTFTFTVTRTVGAIGTSSVDYAVTGSGANPVVAADFGGSLPTGTVNFAAGQSTAVVSITVAAATTVGSDKTFTVTLSNPVNASVAGVSATGVIANDVTAPAVAASGGGGGGSFGWLMLALLMSFVPLRKQR